jgi:hypothetical protein
MLPADRASLNDGSARDIPGMHRAFWNMMRRMDDPAREDALAELAVALGTEPVLDAPVMSPDDVRRLAAGGGFSIGAHSRMHPSLPMLAPAVQREEMAASRDYLEALTGERIDAFAYPFGDFDRTTEFLVKDVGFRYAASVLGGAATSAAQLWKLPRLDVKDWNAEEFRNRLQWTA